ncbi:LysR substrate-binding domain-containing protein [Paracoccus saliphilus]|uniref:LysR family transcriptional regulator n=1 Tax=Paracoccus saliphilus TaxID=405559 RepID=A0AA45W8K1_9RHOB|nr:LysR substrate-binding domain-containing protein [Paracoccus saliphilus]WCR02668.1 LysR family transcriptional regulator [Paracoccus saliphilus]SIT17417.1 LysR family transcriptional regulator, glycine cleavage system transcriptional activator [Paracoccus saliphilus]
MRRLPPLHALRAFEAAARHLHFGHAAAELHLTPTAISHQIRQLEAILGVKLFIRHPRPVRLTREGEMLFPVLNRSLDQIAAAIATVSSEDAGRPLSVSVTMAFASRWLMPRLAQLREETGIELIVNADDRPAIFQRDNIDLAIRYANDPSSEGNWTVLFADRLVPMCSPRLLEEIDVPFDPEHLSDWRLIHYDWKQKSAGSPTWKNWLTRINGRGVAPPIAQVFSEEIHALDAAIAGLGVVLASEIVAADDLRKGHLIKLSEHSLDGQTFWAVFQEESTRKKDILCIIDWMRNADRDEGCP